jgi:hypothetical protein
LKRFLCALRLRSSFSSSGSSHHLRSVHPSLIFPSINAKMNS